ncbi:hypothetical protein FZEAL_4819 [Fusarium zealandicum]|uniref:Uncharacterized protein n=1 Tax=Fusarium zealandicum TaxID=1053134 RepID=A0A8H4XKF3_9HYPO|nr:hypothetical protein FZEAL_4819 [Fusarium zealandicum]
MRFSPLLVAPLVLLSQLVSGAQLEQPMEEICAGVPGIDGCKGSLNFPTSCMADEKGQQLDSCKTKNTFKYPCPTWSNPTKLCDGETCVPGFVDKDVDYPCGIAIATKPANTCQTIRDKLGSAGSVFISSVAVMCDCLPKMVAYGASGVTRSLLTPSSSLASGSGMSTSFLKLQNCFVDNLFDIADDRDEVYANELTNKDGAIFFTAAEITLAIYEKLAMVVGSCLSPVSCNPSAVSSFFKDYLGSSALSLTMQLAKLVDAWIGIFGSMKGKIEIIRSASETLPTPLATVAGRVTTVKKTVCLGRLCSGLGVSGFMKKVAKALENAQALQSIRDAADTAASAAPELITEAQKTIATAKTIPDAGFFMNLIKSGVLRKPEDIPKAIPIVQKFPKSVAQMKDIVAPIDQLVSGYETLTADAQAAIKDVINFSWTPYAKELNADASGKLKKGLTEIQSLFKAQLNEPVTDLAAGIKALKDSLADFPVNKDNFAFDIGMTTYNRWSYVTVDAPCSKKLSKTFQLGGFKKTFNYVQIYSCPWGPQEITWPDHLVPYVKIQMS